MMLKKKQHPQRQEQEQRGDKTFTDDVRYHPDKTSSFEIDDANSVGRVD